MPQRESVTCHQGGDGKRRREFPCIPALSQPMYEVTPSDVLSGRGKFYSNHAGNQDFRITIGLHLDSYISAEYRFRKTKIVKNIIAKVRNEFGGKFLKKVEDVPKGWIDIGDEEAQRKVSHALRDANAERIKNFAGITGPQVKQLLYNKTVTCVTPPLLCPGSPKRKFASRATSFMARMPPPITKKKTTKKKHSTTLVKQPAKVKGKFLSNPSQQATARKVSFCKDSSSALMFDAAPSEYHHHYHHDHYHVVPFISNDEKQDSCNPIHNNTNSGSDCCGVEIHLITPLLSLLSKSCNSSESIETMSCSDDSTDESFVECPEVYPRFMDHVMLQINTIPVFDIDKVFSSDDEDNYLPHLLSEEVKSENHKCGVSKDNSQAGRYLVSMKGSKQEYDTDK
jgi:hypothetical protein